MEEKRFYRITDKIYKGAGILGAVSLIVMMLTMVLNIILRVVADPILNAYDIVCQSAALAASMCIAYMTYCRGQVVMDSLLGQIRKKSELIAKILETISGVLSVGIWVILFVSGLQFAIQKYLGNETNYVGDIPIWFFRFMWSLGCLLVIFAFIFETVDCVIDIRNIIRNKKNKKEEGVNV